jgi:hypothetical protein
VGLKCSLHSISEPKCRKNFILENVRQLREMQGHRRKEEEGDTVTGRFTANSYEYVPARTPNSNVSRSKAKLLISLRVLEGKYEIFCIM